MTDHLTQSEIDSLIRGTPSAAPVVEALPYNFLQPPRISKEHRIVLQAINERFAVALQSYLSTRLHTPVELTAQSAEQATFGEALQALGSPCAAYVFRVTDTPPLHGYLDLDTELAFHLVDRLFGGAAEAPPPGRPLTPLERTVVGGVVDRALQLYRDAWQDHVAMTPAVEGFETSPDALNITAREDNCLVTHLEFHSGATRAYFTICFPLTVIDGFLGASLRGRRVSASSGGDSGARTLVESALQQAGLVLTARFPAVRVSARTLAQLKPGQVLETGHPVDQPIEVYVNGELGYLGAVGQTRRRLGVRISEPITTRAGSRPATRHGQTP
jgi:flagellar motor switch protein FliM